MTGGCGTCTPGWMGTYCNICEFSGMGRRAVPVKGSYMYIYAFRDNSGKAWVRSYFRRKLVSEAVAWFFFHC